ncbi:MAG: cytochrome c biogenesis protein CcsA [Spirochaetia bacterium]|jgi:cytochrome c-type biogenesis protein CcmF|nr:cytochrome c biogenesis protein CcsA [Spirochaetia bacterium]
MNIGNLLLVAALASSLISLFYAISSASGRKSSFMVSRQLFYLSGIMILFAFIFLLISFLTDDFRFYYVYNNSSTSLSPAYKTAAVWAGKEGSFLLWLLFLAFIGVVIAKTEKNFTDIVLAVVSVTQIFILIMLITESPFTFIWNKYPDDFRGNTFLPQGFDGLGMNPLLADPWMITHPPLLFLGYASAVVPFAYAVAAMIRNDYKKCLENSYRWILFSIITLGIGIFLGAYWAYKVLGWGGFWGWDPVENSSLIPWIAALALLHTTIVQKRKGALVRTSVLLSMTYFLLVLYSTFLTRSGVLSDFSVHSFAGGGTSWVIVLFILFSLAAGLYLFIKNLSSIKGASLGEKFWAWDNFTVYGVISLIIFAIIVLVGTSMPILSGVFAESAAGATADFYNKLSIPFSLLFLVFMVLSTISMQNYKKATAAAVGIASAAVAVIVNLYLSAPLPAYFIMAASLFVLIQYIIDLIVLKKKPIASRLAHIGAALLIMGCMASGYYSETYQKELSMLDEEQIGPVTLTFEKLNETEKSSLEFTMTNGSNTERFACPYYISEQTQHIYKEPYVSRRLWGDIYISADNYTSGRDQASSLIITAGQEAVIGDCTIAFQKLNTENMMSDTPAIYAEMTVNGQNVRPGIKLENGHRHPVAAFVPGTKREIRLLNFSPEEKTVRIDIEPSSAIEIPADTVSVELSVKPLIWLVWLGTLLITAAGITALGTRRKGSPG